MSNGDPKDPANWPKLQPPARTTHALCPDEDGRCQYGRDEVCPKIAERPSEKLQPLNCDRDPRRWASEFNEVIGMVSNGGHEPINEGLLVAWFANAMMCGEDTYRWRTESEIEATECYRAALQKIADDYPRATNEGAQKWARDALKNTAAPQAGEAHPPCTGATGPAAAAVPSASEFVDIVFDGPPGPKAPCFVEVESPPGTSIRFGEWVPLEDGYWALRFRSPQSPERAQAEEKKA